MGIKVTETVLGSAQESLPQARLSTEEMLPIAASLDEAGFHALDVLGEISFTSCLRILHEDPWDRVRTLKQRLPRTPLQMRMRALSIAGDSPEQDARAERFCRVAVESGISTIRVLDEHNRIPLSRQAIRAVKAAGGHAQGTVVYSGGAPLDAGATAELAIELVHTGAESICLADPEGVLGPFAAAEIVRRLRSALKVPLALDVHDGNGLAQMTALAAIEAGVDIVAAATPLSAGGSQPSTLSLVLALRGTIYDTGLDLTRLTEIAAYFRRLGGRYTGFDFAPTAEVAGHRVAGEAGSQTVLAGMDGLAMAGDSDRSDVALEAYAMAPAAAREYLTWRATGGRPEPELVAALAAALFGRDQAATASVAGLTRIWSPWKLAGRRRVLGVR